MWANIVWGFVEKCNSVAEHARVLECCLASSVPCKIENPLATSVTDALGFEPRIPSSMATPPAPTVVNNLVQYLAHAALPGLPAPGALILLSPTMDWGNTYLGTPASTMHTNAAMDLVRPIMLNGYNAASMLETNARLLSASQKLARKDGLLTDYPPTMIIAGGVEQVVDVIRTFRNRLTNDSGKEKVVCLEYADVFRDWLMIPWIGARKGARRSTT